MRTLNACVISVLLVCAQAATAAVYQVRSEAELQTLLDSGQVAAGDRLVLHEGRHGQVVIKGLAFDPPVTLTTNLTAPAILDQLTISESAGWIVENITVMPRAPSQPGLALVAVQKSANIVLDRLTVASAQHSDHWSAQDWRRNAWNGIVLSGRNITVSRSDVRNVRHGISANADYARIEDNVVDTFSGDGLRGLGDNSAYIGNMIKTCVDVDENHDDGFQSWSLGPDDAPGMGVVRNVRLEDNLIEQGDHALSCNLQGIGLFGGFYEDWGIRGNTVVVNHWHGITVMGGRNVVISDNVVVDARPGAPGPPWVTITPHVDGRVSQDSRIERNVTMPFSGGPNSPFGQPQVGVSLRDNVVVGSPSKAFATSPGRPGKK